MHLLTRKVKEATLIAMIATIVCAAPLVAGQRMQINVPYAFKVASQQLPPGDYLFTVGETRLVVESKGIKINPLFLSRLSGPNTFLQSGSLVFEEIDGTHILAEVWLPNASGIVMHGSSKNAKRSVLSFTELSPNAHPTGKTAFELTCARCHGDNGKGSEAADKFFGMKLPRLSSKEVQSKTDAELTEIIMKGTQVMPAVEVEQEGFRHRLPPQDRKSVV